MNVHLLAQQQLTNTLIPGRVDSTALQRKCACGKSIIANGECAECNKKRLKLQRKGVSSQNDPQFAPPIVHEVLRSPGRPLDNATRAQMESHFVHDFTHVRVHTDNKANDSANAVNSKAYTLGSHIVFGKEYYRPQTNEGKKLIAHEITHIIQQKPVSRMVPHRIELGSLNDQFEKQAEKMSANIKTNTTRSSLTKISSPRLQRQPESHTETFSHNDRLQSIPFGRWSERVEAEYRRAGLIVEANAVRGCREEGNCTKVLTIDEAWQMFESGRSIANLEPPSRSEAGLAFTVAPVALGTLVTPATQGSAVAAESALAQAAARWGTAGFIEGGIGTAVAGGAPAAVTITPPATVIVGLTIAVVDLFKWASFQSALQKQGFIILPDPLAVCIGSCHYSPRSSGPSFREFPNIPPIDLLLQPQPSPLAPDVAKEIERWIQDQSPQTDAPKPSLDPIPTPLPQPDPDQRRRRRKQVNIILKLPPQKSVHLPLYASLVRERRLVHDINYARGKPAQVTKWNKNMHPRGGFMPWEVWERGDRLGLTERQILRPNWSRDRLGTGMDVDHIVELQVTPNHERDIWNEIQNYELLDSSSNSSSGTKLDSNIAAERRRLVTVTKDPSYLFRPLVFNKIQPSSGQSGERWLFDDIRSGQHLDSYEELTGTKQ